MDHFKIPSWLVKNPLGIVALFISLIYAMSAALLGVSVERLTPANQTTLVWFIVAFPFAVLGAFLWLVINHHNKLYAPSDYRTDEGFLSASRIAPPASLGARLQAEIDEGPVVPITVGDDTEKPANQEEGNKAIESPNDVPTVSNPARRLEETYLLEGLVFQELQRELGGSILREVEMSLGEGDHVRVDGVVRTDREVVAVDVNILRSRLDRTLSQARALMDKFILSAARNKSDMQPFRLIEVFVLDGDVAERYRSSLVHLQQQSSFPVDIRIFTARYLREKYGIIGDSAN
ncbi:MAG: hypothetical protein KGR48_16950 [Alphaproteobacteria bacterium]|nr:hypothetical protein [Alphaproteobacteria bacterium]MDE2014663.1 hypothetical protein [Alphaproteobacteria bacterium]MDE2352874.1 hypothetical protein [Alphaproteobacteria bacterium]